MKEHPVATSQCLQWPFALRVFYCEFFLRILSKSQCLQWPFALRADKKLFRFPGGGVVAMPSMAFRIERFGVFRRADQDRVWVAMPSMAFRIERQQLTSDHRGSLGRNAFNGLSH